MTGAFLSLVSCWLSGARGVRWTIGASLMPGDDGCPGCDCPPDGSDVPGAELEGAPRGVSRTKNKTHICTSPQSHIVSGTAQAISSQTHKVTAAYQAGESSKQYASNHNYWVKKKPENNFES